LLTDVQATHKTLFSPPLPPHKASCYMTLTPAGIDATIDATDISAQMSTACLQQSAQHSPLWLVEGAVNRLGKCHTHPQVAAIARMGMGTINKVFVSSSSQPNTGSPRQPGAYNLLWSAASPAAADSFLGPQESTQSSGNASPNSTNNVQPARPGAEASMIDWRKGAYAIRFQGSEFVTSKALAHCGAADGGVKVGSRYSGSAGIADVDAQLEPVQPVLGQTPVSGSSGSWWPQCGSPGLKRGQWKTVMR
jgi:hypothetical protein